MFVFYYSHRLLLYKCFLHYIDLAQGLPIFNARRRIFAAAIRSNFQSYFQPECGDVDDANSNHKQPPPYNDNLNKFSEEEKDYYKKPIQQSQRRYYPSKHTTYFILSKYCNRELSYLKFTLFLRPLCVNS